MGRSIAKRYHQGELSYAFCDGVMNGLWTRVLEGFGPGTNEMPEPSSEIYEALNAGEFHRKHGKTDDPVAEFTDPAIAELSVRFNF
jgi:hypothetical protein